MKVNREKLRKLVTVTLECEPEDRTYRGEFENEHGQPDRETEAWIEAQLKAGNEWAWCSAHVIVRYQHYEGDDWLGGCSYESKEAFMQPNGYYGDMINSAIDSIAEEIEKLVDGPDIWVHTNPCCLVCAAE